jgi:hypothetical protein
VGCQLGGVEVSPECCPNYGDNLEFVAQWPNASSAVDVLGFLVLLAIPRLLKDQPPALRVRVALSLGVFAVMCFTALHFLP